MADNYKQLDEAVGRAVWTRYVGLTSFSGEVFEAPDVPPPSSEILAEVKAELLVLEVFMANQGFNMNVATLTAGGENFQDEEGKWTSGMEELWDGWFDSGGQNRQYKMYTLTMPASSCLYFQPVKPNGGYQEVIWLSTLGADTNSRKPAADTTYSAGEGALYGDYPDSTVWIPEMDKYETNAYGLFRSAMATLIPFAISELSFVEVTIPGFLVKTRHMALSYLYKRGRYEKVIEDISDSVANGSMDEATGNIAKEDANQEFEEGGYNQDGNIKDTEAKWDRLEERISDLQGRGIRFLEQVYLLANIKDFAKIRSDSEFYDYTEGNSKFKSKPAYDLEKSAPGNKDANVDNHPKREGCWIYPVSGKNIVNKLMGVPNADKYLTLTPDKFSYLVPKVRLVQVVHQKFNKSPERSSKGLKRTTFETPAEFTVPFLNNMAPDDISNMLNSKEERGSGVGLDSFEWNYKGSNPVSATRDITATLKIKAQNFSDLIKTRPFSIKPPGGKSFTHYFKYANLAMRTAEHADKSPDTVHYKLKAIVGWGWDDHGEQLLDDQEKLAIKNLEMTFYLTIVDHNFNVNEDATVDFQIQYRAYIESAFSNPRANILASEDLKESHEERQAILAEIKKAVDAEKCGEELFEDTKKSFHKVIQAEKSIAYSTILNKLNTTGRIFFNKVTTEELVKFMNDPFRSKERLDRGQASAESVEDLLQTTVDAVENYEEGGDEESRESVLKSLVPTTTGGSTFVSFTYLGDIIDVAIENMMLGGSDDEDKLALKEFKRMRIAVGDLEIVDPKDGSKFYINLVDVPVSVNYFVEWFMDRVTKKQKSQWWLMDFIRDVTRSLIMKTLSSRDYFGTESFSQKASFHVVYALGKGSASRCPLRKLLDKQQYKQDPKTHNRRINLDKVKNPPILGTADDFRAANHNELYHYAIIYAKDVIPRNNKGDFHEDSGMGIPHFHLGSNAGPVKDIKFEKSDQPYIKEARYFRDGFKGLSQLREPYNVSVTLYGQPKLFPGMIVYIDPSGLGADLGKPTDISSLAWTFGFGGYHLITDVRHNISSGQFETELTAKFIYRGNTGQKGNRDGDDEEIATCTDLRKRIATYLDTHGGSIQTGLVSVEGNEISGGVPTTPDERKETSEEPPPDPPPKMACDTASAYIGYAAQIYILEQTMASFMASTPMIGIDYQAQVDAVNAQIDAAKVKAKEISDGVKNAGLDWQPYSDAYLEVYAFKVEGAPLDMTLECREVMSNRWRDIEKAYKPTIKQDAEGNYIVDTIVPMAYTAPEPEPEPEPEEEVEISPPECGEIDPAALHPIPTEILEKITATFKDGCTCPQELAYINPTYYDMAGNEHTGELIVHIDHAENILKIFEGLFRAQFPIEQMKEIVSTYGGDDDKSMKANNTSAYNCRLKTGGSTPSDHSYGKAIDINPLLNPMVTNSGKVYPEESKNVDGVDYTDRDAVIDKHGTIHDDGGVCLDNTKVDIVKLFQDNGGWTWGGDWTSVKDYQHFEKK